MDRVKGWKLLSAAGVAMGLFVFVPFGTGIVRPGVLHTFWNVHIGPQVVMLLAVLPVTLASLITGPLVRPRRPGSIAATIGGVGGYCVLVLPMVLRRLPGTGLVEILLLVLNQFHWSWVLALPLAVSCWVGADYWRSSTWQEFWRGPSGAIIKGALVATMLVLPLRVFVEWYTYPDAQRHYQIGHPPPFSSFPWGVTLLMMVTGSAHWALVFTAVVAFWRPSPWVGAFAGSGIAAGIGALALLPQIVHLVSTPYQVVHDAAMIPLLVRSMNVGTSVILGAIAGSFAGRWEAGPGT